MNSVNCCFFGLLMMLAACGSEAPPPQQEMPTEMPTDQQTPAAQQSSGLSVAQSESVVALGPCMVRSDSGKNLVAIYPQPNSELGPLLEVASGERISELQQNGDGWAKVSYEDTVGWIARQDVACRIAPTAAQSVIESRARVAIQAVQAKDLQTLRDFVHPKLGLRFSPYGFIEPDQDLLFSGAQLIQLADDTQVKQWGFSAGSGEPIELNFEQYYRRFVADRPFADAAVVSYNETNSSGNSPDNSFEVYPSAIVVRFHVKGQVDDSSSDWRELSLAFDAYQNDWYLVGIIHDEWTP